MLLVKDLMGIIFWILSLSLPMYVISSLSSVVTTFLLQLKELKLLARPANDEKSRAEGGTFVFGSTKSIISSQKKVCQYLQGLAADLLMLLQHFEVFCVIRMAYYLVKVSQLTFFNLDQTPIGRRLFQLGADIPVCVMSQTMRMRGIGENLKSVQGLPEMWAILVNPRVAISTPTVF